MKLPLWHQAQPHTRRRLALLAAVMILPLLLGAWREGGKGINPSYVARIKNGQTTKHEILVLFGDPQEVERSSEGVVFTYKSYVDEPPPLPSKQIHKEPEEQSMSRYVIDDEKRIKPKVQKKQGKILKSTLVVRFKAGSDVVQSHEYKEVDGNK